jgi:uncharacterized protein (TIGR02246 family)
MIHRLAQTATLLAVMGLASTAAAHPQDAAINAVYTGLAATRTAHDVAGMAAAFHPQALLIDARPGAPVSGAELAGVLTPQRDRLVKDGVSIASLYRVERRQVIGDGLALDAGYMRQAMQKDGAAEMVRYSRFLVTLKRDADGKWKVVGDAAMPSTAEVWNALKPQEGLQFGG